MVRPSSFQPNCETAATNSFQKTVSLSQAEIINSARFEFDHFRNTLEKHNVDVVCHSEPPNAGTPDAVFPNNWFAVLPTGQGFLFPMCAPNRRREVQAQWIEPFVRTIPLIDLRYFCKEDVYLEGTGSLILDHQNKLGYACLSARTQVPAIKEFERLSGYRVITFTAKDLGGTPFYHTNVMMALGRTTAVVCRESILSESEQSIVTHSIESSGRKIVSISQQQVLEFAGNMLFLSNASGECFWVCSERALKSLTNTQRASLEQDGKFISSPLTTIENIGGGSARCMLGEIF